MSIDLPEGRRISFSPRPTPIPGDMRIMWRLSLIVLMLTRCRSKRASFAKLHLLNDVVRSTYAREQVRLVFARADLLVSWHIRVEPALGRALNFVVGEGFASRYKVANRSGLQLAAPGIKYLEALEDGDALAEETAILNEFAKPATEELVTRLLSRSLRV